MIADLKKDGYRIYLWQLPYFTPKNELFSDLSDGHLAVTDGNGVLPTDDAVLGLSTPATAH